MCLCEGGYICVCVGVGTYVCVWGWVRMCVCGVGTVHGHAVESYLSEQEETKGMKDVQIAEVIG